MVKIRSLEKYLIKIMEKEKYSYLKNITRDRKIKGPVDISLETCFIPLAKENIKKAEERAGFKFPNDLRIFYEEIGYGYLTVPHNALEGYESNVDNEIMNPLQIAEYMKSGHYKYCWDPDSDGVEYPKGWFPFFHISDGNMYFFMDSTDPKKSTVYGDSMFYSTGEKTISPSLPEFIHKLYYEDTEFYLKDK